jgi:hypothetical protein
MKKLGKGKILGIVGGVVVLAAITTAFVAYTKLGSIIEAAIEKVGPQMTKTSVSVGLVTVSPFNGSGSIRGLKVGNPEGFKTKRALKLSKVSIQVDPASLLKDVIVFEKVHVISPEITWEGGMTKSNLTQIQKNVEQFTAQYASKGESSKPKKIIIKEFLLKNPEANVSLKLLGGKAVSLNLPDIQMKNLGGTTGATPKQIISKVIGKLNVNMIKSIANAPDIVKNLGSAAIDGAGSAVKGAGDAAGGAVKGVKGLFGN